MAWELELADTVVFGIGLSTIAYFLVLVLWTLVSAIKNYFPVSSLDFKQFGKFACITGATDGIGKAYALELASKGVDIVLISRSLEKLKLVAQEIRATHGVEVVTIVADFTKPDIYPDIEKRLSGLDIGILVNNVGMASRFPWCFVEYELQFIQDSICCNFLSAAMMTRIVLPTFVEKSKGLLINISSTSGTLPGPRGSIYAATKTALIRFSEGICKEASSYCPNSIIIQDVAPAYVATKLSNRPETSFHVVSTTSFARAALKTVGRLAKTPGCINHQIEVWFLSLVPRWIVAYGVLYLQERKRERLLEQSKKN